MKAFLIKFTAADGTRHRMHGIYEDSCEAVITVMVCFPGARGISAKPVAA